MNNSNFPKRKKNKGRLTATREIIASTKHRVKNLPEFSPPS